MNKLTKKLTLAAAFFMAFGSFQASASDSRELVETLISKAFIPAYGFDDNDNVQTVIEGYLPNSCYTLAQTQVQKDIGSKTIKISQKAIKSSSGICEHETNLPPDLAAQRYFHKVVDIGLLDEGAYEILYLGEEGFQTRTFQVELAPTENRDNMHYVHVTNAFAKEIVRSTDEEFEFRITGNLTSTCAQLADDYYMEKIDDVYVVMLYTFRTEDYCMPTSRPFYKIIKVKTPEIGRYLLHTRSIGGQSKNRIFEIVE